MTEQPVFLYIDDDATSRDVMKMFLTLMMGYQEITILENSRDFEQIIATIEPVPHVIFLDIHVKPHNGFEMLDMIRRNEHLLQTRTIAVTASVMNEDIEKLRTVGFNGIIGKPIDADKFPDTIARILTGEEVWTVI